MAPVLLDQLSLAPVEKLNFPMPADAKLRKIAAAMMTDPSDRATIDDWGPTIPECLSAIRPLSLPLRAGPGMPTRRIVEFGSSMGISAIYLAAALRDNGGGRLIGTDLEPGKAERAGTNVAAAGLAALVEFRVGDARETLKPGVGGDIDMVMLDGAFTLYLPSLKMLEPHLKPGALIIGENAFAEAPGYIDYVRDPGNGYLSRPLPFDLSRGNELTIKTT